MRLRVNQVAFGLAAGVLGARPGRMGVWTQGCSLTKCPGCASRHTWDAEGGRDMAVTTLLRLAGSYRPTPTGLTLSGGEPTDQAPAVAALAIGFREAFPDAELVLYTGLSWRALMRRFPWLAEPFDVIVAGRYARTREATALTGSANQEVRLLTERARELYAGWESWPRHALQVGAGGPGELITVGIPDTARLNRAADRVGASRTTWEPTIEEQSA